jgi:hypothetical protein
VVDSEAAKTLGDEFEKNVKECIHEQFYGGISASVTDDKAVETGRRLLESKYDQPTPPRGLIPEEVLQVQIKAWTTTAETHGLDPPSPDEVRIAMKMDPKEAIQRLFLWTDKPDEIGEGAETFLEALKNESLHLVSEYRDESFRTRENKDIPQVALSPLVKDPTTDDIFQAAFDAWTETAKKNGFSFPSTEEVELHFQSVQKKRFYSASNGQMMSQSLMSSLRYTVKSSIQGEPNGRLHLQLFPRLLPVTPMANPSLGQIQLHQSG